jgi:hypothetical protein
MHKYYDFALFAIYGNIMHFLHFDAVARWRLDANFQKFRRNFVPLSPIKKFFPENPYTSRHNSPRAHSANYCIFMQEYATNAF